MAEVAPPDAAPGDGAAVEKSPEEIKAEQQKAAMLAMAAAAASAAEAEAKKKKGKGKGKKQKGSWDLLNRQDRMTRFWVEQFGRDEAAGNAEASKLQRLVDKKTEENRMAKENWEKEVKKMLKFLYQMDKKVDETRTNGCQSIVDQRKNIADKKAKYEKYWAEALSLDPYEELVVDHSIGRTLSFVVLAQIAQPWGQLSEKLDIASQDLEGVTYFRDQGQYENEAEIRSLEFQVQSLVDDLEANHDFLEALMDKTKRRGLRQIARQADEAKHAAAQTLLTLLSPGDQEEIKNHAWFRAERRAYRKDEEIVMIEIDQTEEEVLLLLKQVLREEEERLMEEVEGLEGEVEGMKEEISGGGGGGGVATADANSNQNNNLEAKPSALKHRSQVRFTEGEGSSIGRYHLHAEKTEVSTSTNFEKSKRKLPEDDVEHDPYRPPCALPYDVPERLARMATEMDQTCRANTTNINNQKYIVDGESMPIRMLSRPEGLRKSLSATSASSRNEFGGIKKKWPVTCKMMNEILPPWDPRKRPPKDEAPRNFRLANGRKPWDASLI